jgi:hypothetical protein
LDHKHFSAEKGESFEIGRGKIGAAIPKGKAKNK